MRPQNKWERRDRKHRKRAQLDMVVDGRATRDVLARLALQSPPKKRRRRPR